MLAKLKRWLTRASQRSEPPLTSPGAPRSSPSSIDSLDSHIRQELASKLPDSRDGRHACTPPTSKPQYLIAAERCARRTGKSVESILQADIEWMRRSRYPTAECFEPHEVEQYAAGLLPESRRVHVEECELCASLLETLGPNDLPALLVEAIRNELPLAVALRTGRGTHDTGDHDDYGVVDALMGRL